MSNTAKKKTYKKIALVLSLCAILLWVVLGTGASLAWFVDTSEEVKNIFHFGDFELAVSHRLPDGTWEPIDSKTDIFDDNARYEPGYVQVVYFKIENRGTVPFRFQTAVNVTDYSVATNVFGQQFHLHEYLRFGIAVADTEEAMEETVKTRALAKDMATMKLNNYATNAAVLDAGKTVYMALAVRMPEDIDNVANYRGKTVPKVELGIIVNASQQKN